VFSWDDDPDLNITPLMDVMLVLMAVLMIVAPTMTYEEKIKLPIGTKSSKLGNQKQFTIRIDKDKKIYIDNSVYSFSNLTTELQVKSAMYDKTSSVYIRADESLPYRDVMLLLRYVKSSGYQNVALITE
jgi:biopolymer transport protein ExbD